MKRFCSVFLMTLGSVAMTAAAAFAFEGSLAWTYNAQYPITSSVAAANGLVIAGDSVGNLHAVQAASGKAAWIYKGANSIVGLPSVSGKMVVFAQGDGTITALNIADGSVIWKYAPPADSYAADTVVDGTAVGDGKVFFVKGDGRLYAISAANGKDLWTYSSEPELRSAPYFANGTLFLGEQNGKFSAIDPKSGKRGWGGGAGGAVNTPVVSGGNVYFSSWDGSVQCVRIKGVIPQWKANVNDPVSTSPFVGGGKVFVGTSNGKVVALSGANGSVLWNFDTAGGTVSAMPVFADGLVFVGGGQGKLFVLDASSGSVRTTFETGGGINGTPAFVGEVLYLGSADGNIYAIR